MGVGRKGRSLLNIMRWNDVDVYPNTTTHYLPGDVGIFMTRRPCTDAWLHVPILIRRCDFATLSYLCVGLRFDRRTMFPRVRRCTTTRSGADPPYCWRKTTQCDTNSRKRFLDFYKTVTWIYRQCCGMKRRSSVMRRHCSLWIRKRDVLDPAGICTCRKWSSRVETLSGRLWLFPLIFLLRMRKRGVSCYKYVVWYLLHEDVF